MARIEQATHIDLNRDGVIGGYRPPADGGIKSIYEPSRISQYTSNCCLGLIGKIESATHIDINRDGRIGGTGVYYGPTQPRH